MKKQKLRTAAGMLPWIMALSFTGCRPAQQPMSSEEKPSAETADIADEARGAAEASLGKQAEILAQGNLAHNGLEQVLVVNRLSAGTKGSMGDANPKAIFVTRAAILEKSGGKWSEILRCDEHLKNTYGYLGNSPKERINGWTMEYTQDAKQGLEMKFTPAEIFDAVHVRTGERVGLKIPALDVRWNKNEKRYQSFDQSHERYLSEVPSLETPQSILK